MTGGSGSDFSGRVCVVTGGGSGIGRATCAQMGETAALVAVVDIDGEAAERAAREIAERGGNALARVADVSRPENVRRLIDDLVEIRQRIDVVVNNATIMTFDEVVDLDVADWDRVLAVNLRSAFLMSKYALPHMRGGAIVNVSSVHAHQTTAGVAPYAASKGALEAFTRALSIECEARQVRVNAVAPGAVDTPLLRSNPNVRSGREKIKGRIAAPEEIAAVICYLASPAASFVMGATIVVDGGRLTVLS